MKALLKTVTAAFLRRAPAGKMASLLHRLAHHYSQAAPPEDGLRFLLDLDSRLYSSLGQAATAFGGGTHPKHELTHYHDFFVARLSPAERVLDVGCGQGELSRDLAERAGVEVLGVELDPANLERAKRLNPHPAVRYLECDITKETPPGRFDAVVLSNVLEHLERRAAILRRLAGLEGVRRLLIRVPLFERDWRVPLKKSLGMEWRLDPTHCIEYTSESFAGELGEAGLAAVHQEVRWGEIWAEARRR